MILETIVAGFILIELLGLTGTLLVGVACSGLVGILFIVLDHRTLETFGSLPPSMLSAGFSTRSVPIERTEFHSSTLRLGLLVAALSGLTSLGYLTLWTRLLASGTGNFTYVFTMILALFLIGIALGAIVFDTIRPRYGARSDSSRSSSWLRRSSLQPADPHHPECVDRHP